MLFSYFHQWGNRPLTKTGFIITATFMAIVIIICLCFCWRFILKIDDKFAIFRADLHVMFKIPIAKIKNVNIERLERACIVGGVRCPGKNIERIGFDFVKQVVSIQLGNGKIYQIAVKDAEDIKEEIEKRMNKE